MLMLAVNCVAAFLVPLSATDLGASPGLLGIIMSVSSVGSLLAAVPAGMLVQRAGTKRPLVASTIVSGLCVAGIAASYSLASIFVCFSLYKVAEIVVYICFQEHVAAWGASGGDTTHDFGWYSFAASLGQLVGPAGAGVLLERAGHRASWAVTAASFVAVGMLGLALVANPPAAGARARPSLTGALGGGRWRAMLGAAGIVAIVASFVVIFAGGSRGTYFPVYLKDLGFSPSITGTLVAVAALSSLLSRLLLRSVVRLCGGVFGAMLASFAGMTVGMALTPLCRTLPALAANSFMVGVGNGVAIPLSMATVAQSAPQELRAVAISVRLTGNRLATLLNPLVFGLVSTLWGVPSAFVAAAGILLVATLSLGAWWRVRGRAAGL